MSIVNELEDLKRQVTDLAQQNEHLKAQIVSAEDRAVAATTRAQTRHTEKMHAIRHAERLEQDLEKEKWERNDNDLKSLRMFNTFKAKIAQYEEEMTRSQWASANITQLPAAQAQVAQLHIQNQATQDENARLKTLQAQQQQQSTSTIEDLNKAVQKLQAELATAQKERAPTILLVGEKQIEVRNKDDFQRIAKQAAQNLEHRRLAAESQMREQFGIMHKQKMEEMRQVFEQNLRQIHAQTERFRGLYAGERQKTAALEHQVREAVQEVDWYKQRAQQHGNSNSISAGKHAGMPLTPQQKDISNKRRRLSTSG